LLTSGRQRTTVRPGDVEAALRGFSGDGNRPGGGGVSRGRRRASMGAGSLERKVLLKAQELCVQLSRRDGVDPRVKTEL
jgi:hypothetical protein